MNEPNDISHKRHPWIAVSLSSIMPGLGQLYCGAVLKCFWLAGLTSLAGVLTFLSLAPVFHLNGNIIFLAQVFFSLLIYGIGILDARFTARRTREDYKLKDYNRWYAYVLFCVAVSGGYLFAGLYVRDSFFQPFKVPSGSMYPAIWPGDHLLAAKNVYLDKDPSVGDIVIFRNPERRGQFFIKRLIALPGDSIEIRDDETYINGIKLRREQTPGPAVPPKGTKFEGTCYYEWDRDIKYRILLNTNTNAAAATRNFPKTVVPKHDCFVLGDNRDDSIDSRNFGVVPIDSIVGKASFLYEPGGDWSRFGSL
ncbi:MAG TPA: signal peptidase I [Candidatus Saccharimonadales bacterium]|nr:signal peptidase I [Candidatus Saccharimonadales bacterium]